VFQEERQNRAEQVRRARAVQQARTAKRIADAHKTLDEVSEMRRAVRFAQIEKNYKVGGGLAGMRACVFMCVDVCEHTCV
jgi:hypothetical protein